jgi:ATP-dependent Clp protease ATP-binding subunit ClpA
MGTPRALVDPKMDYSKVRDTIIEQIRNHFNFKIGRPEILNRFGNNIVVFDFIREPLDEEILDLLISGVVGSLEKENKLHLQLTHDSEARIKLIELARENLAHGGRGIRNVVDTALVDPLARWLFEHEPEAGSHLVVTHVVDHGPDTPNQYELTIQVLE